MLKQIEMDEPVSAVAATTSPAVAAEVQASAMIPPVSADFKSLSQRLASRDASVRAEAERQLRGLDVTTLIALMVQQRSQRKRRMIGLIAACAIIMFLVPLLAFWLHTPSAFMFFWSTAMGLIVAAVAFTQAQKSGAIALAQMEDPKAVGELIAALEMRDDAVQRVVRPALTRLLPRLRSHDSSLLNAGERRVLRQFMLGTLYGNRFGRLRDPEEETLLVLAALKALEQVGDATFLPIVSELAVGHKRGSNSRIRQAAEECLPYLEQCSANRQISMEMLRASAPDHSRDAEALLRPAADKEGASTENLLLPSISDESENT